MASPSSCLRALDCHPRPVAPARKPRFCSDSWTAPPESTCSARSRAPPPGSAARTVRTSSTTFPMHPASASRRRSRRAGGVQSRPSLSYGSSMTATAPQCVGGATLAFTQVGSRVIRVCGRQFRDRFLGNRRTTEFIMIHEFLHTLGLGENPPTSQAITEQVKFRCGL